jgi:hypothetical protein
MNNREENRSVRHILKLGIKLQADFAHEVIEILPPFCSLIHLCLIRLAGLRTLTVCLCRIVTIDDNQILRAVVVLASEVGIENGLGSVGVSLLSIERGTGHVGNHGVSATEGVLGVAEWVVLGCWLREPDVSSVTAEVAGLEGLSDVFLDDDGTSGGVDEP